MVETIEKHSAPQKPQESKTKPFAKILETVPKQFQEEFLTRPLRIGKDILIVGENDQTTIMISLLPGENEYSFLQTQLKDHLKQKIEKYGPTDEAFDAYNGTKKRLTESLGKQKLRRIIDSEIDNLEEEKRRSVYDIEKCKQVNNGILRLNLLKSFSEDLIDNKNAIFNMVTQKQEAKQKSSEPKPADKSNPILDNKLKTEELRSKLPIREIIEKRFNNIPEEYKKKFDSGIIPIGEGMQIIGEGNERKIIIPVFRKDEEFDNYRDELDDYLAMIKRTGPYSPDKFDEVLDSIRKRMDSLKKRVGRKKLSRILKNESGKLSEKVKNSALNTEEAEEAKSQHEEYNHLISYIRMSLANGKAIFDLEKPIEEEVK